METPRIPSSPPLIQKADLSAERPQWSVMIPVYNGITFLELTLQSILLQASSPGQMQIEVIDDASTDGNVRELVERVGGGRIAYYRHPENRGSLRTFETCINRSRGHYIHILHADDLVKNGYYLQISNLFTRFPEAGAAFCRFEYINDNGVAYKVQSPEISESGILPDWLRIIATTNRAQFAAMTVKREVYETVGSYFGLTYGEDWVMWVRIAKHFNVAYTPSTLASYRKHTGSITGNKIASGEYMRDLKKAMDFIQQELPPELKSSVYTASRKYYANYGLNMGFELYHKRQPFNAVNASIMESLRMYQSPGTIRKAASLYARIILRAARKAVGIK